MSLRSKLFGAIGATLCVLLGVLVFLALVQERSRAAREAGLRGTMLEYAADLCAPADLVSRSALVRGDRLHPRVRVLAIYNPTAASASADHSGAPTRLWGSMDADPELAARAARLVDAAWRSGETQFEGNSAAVPTRRGGDTADPKVRVAAVVFVELREGAELDPVEVSRATYLAIVAAGALLLVVTWFLVDRVVSRPLREVVEAAGRVAAGDYSKQVPESGRDDEIEKVVEAFNSMMVDLDRLQGRMKAQMGDVLAEARRTQDSLVIAQRLAATGRLAAGIAHEVNNPLAGMIEAIRALRTREMAEAKREEYLELVEEGLHRIEATVARILQFTPHKVAPRPMTFDEIVRPVIALARHRIEKQQVEAVIDGADEPAQVYGDPYELQQALLNVVLNALDALEEAHPASPTLRFTTIADERDVRLVIRDNGRGIRPEDMPRVFDLFFTTKEPGKGTGLGLATAHKILTDHGGRLELRSDRGAGTEVEFSLPRFSV
ncbi:MAG: HAMP domain-containing histidine kinase [Planctomycetes bacterium]|nr:HAMP domain-containing histidine kinase [Planctomycetota bacterium]